MVQYLVLEPGRGVELFTQQEARKFERVYGGAEVLRGFDCRLVLVVNLPGGHAQLPFRLEHRTTTLGEQMFIRELAQADSRSHARHAKPPDCLAIPAAMRA
ncbi:hypothetical protein [Deinococcus sp. QL22]|uniref:hypothetical protein n=1 Tax=Deinococcus sp. QL22 TaxID=2939437 RepID=UPI00201824E1|nr:hypothetical protein [Deinococcus sp. QL22]UQN10675.1 hypothetical protein M1R55_30330 [Deinococcus sp. QL22]